MKPELEFQQPTGVWEQAFDGIDGIEQLILSKDEDKGDYTRILRWAPGADSSPAGALTHDFWEEVYIVEGSVVDLRLNQTFTAGSYCCRPPGMVHGPWRSENGCKMVEFRYGFN